jgi:hypothetical protein
MAKNVIPFPVTLKRKCALPKADKHLQLTLSIGARRYALEFSAPAPKSSRWLPKSIERSMRKPKEGADSEVAAARGT